MLSSNEALKELIDLWVIWISPSDHTYLTVNTPYTLKGQTPINP